MMAARAGSQWVSSFRRTVAIQLDITLYGQPCLAASSLKEGLRSKSIPLSLERHVFLERVLDLVLDPLFEL